MRVAKRMSKAVAAAVAAGSSLLTASAYIDPGTAGIVVNSATPWIVAAFAAVLAFAGRFLYQPAKRLMLRVLRLIRAVFQHER